MKKDEVNFWEPGPQWIIVRKLTEEILQEAITAFVEDENRPTGYWIEAFHFALDIEMDVLKKLKAKEIRQGTEVSLKYPLGELKEQINQLESSTENPSKKSDLLASLDSVYEELAS